MGSGYFDQVLALRCYQVSPLADHGSMHKRGWSVLATCCYLQAAYFKVLKTGYRTHLSQG